MKLLATGAADFDVPVHLAVTAASRGAIDAIEKAGGSLRTVYYDRHNLRAILKPHKFARIPANPPPRLMARYMDPERRGYLSHLSEEHGDKESDPKS